MRAQLVEQITEEILLYKSKIGYIPLLHSYKQDWVHTSLTQLHGHRWGTHTYIFNLKDLILGLSLMLSGTCFQILGRKYDIDC